MDDEAFGPMGAGDDTARDERDERDETGREEPGDRVSQERDEPRERPDERPATDEPAGSGEAPEAERPVGEAPEAPEADVASEAAPERAEEPDEEAKLEIPDILPILPLRDTVVYPFAVVPLGVGKERSVKLIDDAMRGSRLVGLVAQKDSDVEQAGPADCFRMGTAARIARLLRIPDGTIQVIVQGLERIAILDYVEEEPFLKAHVRSAPETTETDMQTEALKRNAIELFQRLVGLVQYLPNELAVAALNLDDARQVVYLIAGSVQMDLELRQQLLEMDSVRAKLEKVTTFLTRELEVLELGKKIQSQAHEPDWPCSAHRSPPDWRLARSWQPDRPKPSSPAGPIAAC